LSPNADVRTWCEHQRCITVRFSLPGRPGVNLDAHNSFGNKAEAQIRRSDLYELEVEKREKMLAEGQALNVDFQPSHGESHRSIGLGVAKFLQ
jgi:hypothetical protein